MNIRERIEALETEFNEKIKALKAEMQREDEFPQDGEDYWLISGDGCVTYTMFTDNHVDLNRTKIGNIFRTKEEAEFAVEKLKVEAELRKFSKTFDSMESNVLLTMSFANGEIDIRRVFLVKVQGAIYFESEEKANEAIDSVGEERIKKYIFGVED